MTKKPNSMRGKQFKYGKLVRLGVGGGGWAWEYDKQKKLDKNYKRIFDDEKKPNRTKE
jgi:hypothetical protein